MSTVRNFRAVTSLFVAVTVGAFIAAPACSESKCGDGTSEESCSATGGTGNEGGAGNTGGTGTTGGADGSGGTGTEGGAGGAATGGSSSEGGAAGGGGEGTLGGSDAGGAGGAGGANGKTCTAPPAGQTAAKGKSCTDYCDDFFANCDTYNTDNSTWANKGECLSTCELFDDAQLCCRISHATSAATTAADCAEAAGDGSVCN